MVPPVANPSAAEHLAGGVKAEFRRRLQGEYVPRLGRCLDLLTEPDVWRRPAPNCNSVGNLLLHLAGNITQWILVPFAGRPDDRNRPAEFAATSGASGKDLLLRLATVVDEACAAVDAQSVDELLRERTIQQRYRETGLAAILHVMEHMSGHSGQIYAFTKQVTGRDLAFYDL